MQSIDPMERYSYGTSEDVSIEKEEIKCNNIIKWYKKKWLNLMMLQKKT